MNINSHLKYHTENKEIVIKTNNGTFNFENTKQIPNEFLNIDVDEIVEDSDIIFIKTEF